MSTCFIDLAQALQSPQEKEAPSQTIELLDKSLVPDVKKTIQIGWSFSYTQQDLTKVQKLW